MLTTGLTAASLVLNITRLAMWEFWDACLGNNLACLFIPYKTRGICGTCFFLPSHSSEDWKHLRDCRFAWSALLCPGHPLIFRWFRCPLRGQSSLGCSLCTLPAAAQSPAGTVPPAALPPLLLRLPPAGGARARGTAFPATTFTGLTILRPSCADSDMERRYAPQSSEQHLNLGVLNHLDHLTSDI